MSLFTNFYAMFKLLPGSIACVEQKRSVKNDVEDKRDNSCTEVFVTEGLLLYVDTNFSCILLQEL